MNLKEYIKHIKSICKQGILRHKNVILDETFQKELLEIIKCYEQLQQENQKYKEVIDKAIEYIEKHKRKDEFLELNEWGTRDLLDILKEVE